MTNISRIVGFLSLYSSVVIMGPPYEVVVSTTNTVTIIVLYNETDDFVLCFFVYSKHFNNFQGQKTLSEGPLRTFTDLFFDFLTHYSPVS